MKKLALTAALLILPAVASAQAEYSATWSIIGTIGDNKYDTLRLDIEESRRFLAVNGSLHTGTGVIPVTGTCIYLVSSTIHCSLTAGPATYTVDIASGLNGTIKRIDSFSGQTSASAAIQLTEIR